MFCTDSFASSFADYKPVFAATPASKGASRASRSPERAHSFEYGGDGYGGGGGGGSRHSKYGDYASRMSDSRYSSAGGFYGDTSGIYGYTHLEVIQLYAPRSNDSIICLDAFKVLRFLVLVHCFLV